MKIFLNALLVVTLVCGLGGFSLVSVANAAISTFDTDFDGWTSNTPPEIEWAPTGGNPDGYVRFIDATGNTTNLSAPSKFLGDWSALDDVGTIIFDHKIFSTGGGRTFLPYRIDIAGPGGAAFWEGETPSGPTDWPLSPNNTVVSPLSENDWSIMSGLWPDLLSNITDFRIRIEHIDNTGSPGPEIAGIDNVQLTPIPGAIWLLASGLMGLLAIRKKLRK